MLVLVALDSSTMSFRHFESITTKIHEWFNARIAGDCPCCNGGLHRSPFRTRGVARNSFGSNSYFMLNATDIQSDRRQDSQNCYQKSIYTSKLLLGLLIAARSLLLFMSTQIAKPNCYAREDSLHRYPFPPNCALLHPKMHSYKKKSTDIRTFVTLSRWRAPWCIRARSIGVQ